MPVILPPERGENEEPPRPPNAIIWIVLFVVFMVGGIVIAILTWPKGEPTNTALFWIRTLVWPPVAFGIVWGLRLLFYDQEVDRLKAEDDTRQKDREKTIRFASEPLAVLEAVYLCSAGGANVAGKIASGAMALEAQTAASGAEGVRHTALDSIEGDMQAKRYRASFGELLAMLKPTIESLPRDVRLDVRLHVPSGSGEDELLDVWRECWRQGGFRRVTATLLPAEHGLMALDDWLDKKGGHALEKLTLFVSAQLHDAPPEGSAEAAVAVLLAWAPLAGRLGLESAGMLHRPVETQLDGLGEAIPKAVLWGKAVAGNVKDLWEAGLDSDVRSALLDAASVSKLGVAEVSGFEGLHDIDAAIGHPGVCAGWLAVALATEYVAQVNSPQCIAWREGSLRLAMIQPVAQAREQMEANA